jgi:SAM-dependent methyltransferase
MVALPGILQKMARWLGLDRYLRSKPSGQAGWSGNGMVATMNGTGFMFEVRDRFANDFIRYSGEISLPVLEIGCAYGVSTLPALEAGARITASDMDQRHLDILRSKVPAHLLPNLTLVQAALPGADFPEGRFGAILCSRVLHFLKGEDIDTSVRKMARWLAPGGRLYLVADTPYGIWRKAVPQFEAGKQAGERWPGMMVGLHNYLTSSGPVKPIEKPPFMNLLDMDLLSRTCQEAGLTVVDAAFIDRSDFKGAGRMDGRENAGVMAVKP